jgi:hypothetical protein
MNKTTKTVILVITRLLIILVVLILFICVYQSNSEAFSNIKTKPIIWMYWENKRPNKKRPAYLDVCLETIKKHCNTSFEIKVLNESTVFDYLPNVRRDLDAKCSIPQKTDYYRYMLLERYGGVWLDSDIIMMKDLKPIIDKLASTTKYEYIGAGCHDNKCKPSGYPKPSNWFMASRKGGKLMSRCLSKADEILDAHESIKTKYFIIGRELMWSEIDFLLKNDTTWSYYHLPSVCTERDSNDNKYVNKRMLSDESNDAKCANKQYFIPIYNTAPGFPEWFKEYNREQILAASSNLLISKLFRESLGL